VAPAHIPGVELSMDVLGRRSDAAAAQAGLGPLVSQYRAWITAQQAHIPATPARRRDTATELLHRAGAAADRMAHGVQLLSDPLVCLSPRPHHRLRERRTPAVAHSAGRVPLVRHQVHQTCVPPPPQP
jgi:hypothetical protein